MTKMRIATQHTIELIELVHRILMYNNNLISNFPHRFITNTCQIMTMVITTMMMIMMMIMMMSEDDDNDGDRDVLWREGNRKMRHCE